MKTGWLWLMVALMVVGVMALAWSQAEQQGERGQRGERGADRGERGQRGGMMMLPPGAYLTVTDASTELWRQIGELQVELHTKTWELSMLHSEGAGEEQVEAKVEELRTITMQLRARSGELREYLVMPEGVMRGPREGGGAGGR